MNAVFAKLTSAKSFISSGRSSLTSGGGSEYAQQQAENKLYELSQNPSHANERHMEHLINPATGGTYTDAQIWEAVENAEIREAENTLLELSGDPANQQEIANLINPETGNPYTDAEIQQAVDNAQLRQDVATAEDTLYDLSKDSQSTGDIGSVINPLTGEPYTETELASALDNAYDRRAITISGNIPERLIISAVEDNVVYIDSLSHPIEITGGFFESHPTHAQKNVELYISQDDPQKILQSPAGDRVNIGIDYVVKADPPVVESWFNGTVIGYGPEGGYGNRVHVETDQYYNFNGKDYPIYTAYAHLDSFDPNLGNNAKIVAGEPLGIMGNTGGSHGAHVDMQVWIETPVLDSAGNDTGRTQKVTISPSILSGGPPT